jgi:hypothetical protein
MIVHTNDGNCFAKAYDCPECGADNLCDVCHEHEYPRGDCEECAPCPLCEGD